MDLKVRDCGYLKHGSGDKPEDYEAPVPPDSVLHPPRDKKVSDAEHNAKAAAALAEWKDKQLCVHDYSPCPDWTSYCTLEDDQYAAKVHRIAVAKAKFLSPWYAPDVGAWENEYTRWVTACWSISDPQAVLACSKMQVEWYLSHQPQVNPVPPPPRKLSFWQRVGCEIKRGFCIIGCTIKNIVLIIAQAILNAAQGILNAIKWIVDQITNILITIMKNLNLEIGLGTKLTEKVFEFWFSFFLQLTPGVDLSFKVKMSLNVMSLTSMVKKYWQRMVDWFKSKFGGQTSAAEEKNPALSQELKEAGGGAAFAEPDPDVLDEDLEEEATALSQLPPAGSGSGKAPAAAAGNGGAAPVQGQSSGEAAAKSTKRKKWFKMLGKKEKKAQGPDVPNAPKQSTAASTSSSKPKQSTAASTSSSKTPSTAVKSNSRPKK